MAPTSDPTARLIAFGRQLIDVHQWLRRELVAVRTDVEAAVLGSGPRPKDLRAHCLTFCNALGEHHSAEDDEVFPALSQQFLALRPVLELLFQDHHMVADILRRLATAVDRLDADRVGDPVIAREVRGEIDGLTAILESHFDYEERKLVDVLNGLNPEAGSAMSHALTRATTVPASNH